MSDIADWLDRHGLGTHAAAFEANHIEIDTLRDLTEADLRELGLSIGHRRKLMQVIRAMAEGGSVAPPPPSVRANETERRQITVLFADVVGYTSLSRRLDPEELFEAINVYQEVCGRVIRRHGGIVSQYVGDGLVALFGWPIASEHDARNGVRSGLAIQAEIAGIGMIGGEPLQVRIGVATGLALVGDLGPEGSDVMGDVPNLAARLQGVARPGEVVVADTTRQLVERAFDCRPIDTVTLKGFENDTGAWQVIGARAEAEAVGRQNAQGVPLIGRGAELKHLRSGWAAALTGESGVLCIRGEAGMGKSRLLAEFLSGLGDGAEVLRLFGAPDAGQSPLRPVVELLERLAGFRAEEGAEARAVRLAALLEKHGLDRLSFEPIFAEALGFGEAAAGVSAERRRAMLFEGTCQILAGIAANRPTAIAFEDLHWLDPATLDFAAQLPAALAGTRALVVATARPEGPIPWGEDATDIIDLARLGEADAVALLRHQSSGANALDDGALRQIIERSGGVPLYLEELTKSASDAPESEGQAIPVTLQDALMARLDRLGEARRITLMAAVIGREFSAGLLGAVMSMPATVLAAPLDRLVDEGILSCETPREDAAPTYRFRHVLLAEAAYESQLRSRRRAAHGAVADVLAKRFPQEIEAAPERLARHLLAAGRPAEAVPLFRQAGLRALGRAHYPEAEQLLGAALEALQEAVEEGAFSRGGSRQTELEILSEFGTAQIALKGFAAAEVGEVFDRAEALGREIGPGPSLARALWGAWLYNLVSGDLIRAEALARELLALGEGARAEAGDTGLLTEAHWAFGDTLFWRGRVAEASKALDESLALFDPEAHGQHALMFGQDPCVAAHCYQAYASWALSDHARVRSSIAAAIRRAGEISHPFSMAWALCFGPLVATWREEPWVAKRLSAIALAHTERQIVPFWQSAMTIVHGWARAGCGEVEEGCRMAEEGLAFYQAIGSKTVQPYFRGLVAECLRASGRHDEAAAMIREAFDGARASGETVSEIWLHIYDARLRRARGAARAEVIEALEKAIDMARETGAVELELTAAVERDRMADEGEGGAWVRPALARAVNPQKSRAGRRAIRLAAEEDSAVA
ncbi:MAG: adenylate/guanylate cyclase domain-containing protein [Pseudomonadota bacterium]